MIDYEKIKLCHEMCIKSKRYHAVLIIGVDWTYEIYECSELIGIELTIDNLIAKLRELTQPEEPKAKYKVGDQVWTYTHGIIKSWLIEDIKWDVNFNDYRVNLSEPMGKASLKQSQLYPTRLALIEKKIDYWRDLLSENLEQHISPYCEPVIGCQHQPDYQVKPNYNQHNDGTVSCVEFMCKKCGEFYR